MARLNWRKQYDEQRDTQEGDRAGVTFEGESLTQQQFTNDADINTLVKRFGITDGAIPPAALDPQYFGDFTDVPDFRQALDATRQAQERFEQLPADIRNRFYNDPVKLWEFVTDENNAEEAVRLGLLHKQNMPETKAEAAKEAAAPPA